MCFYYFFFFEVCGYKADLESLTAAKFACLYRFVKTQLTFEKETKRDKPPNPSAYYVWGSKVRLSLRFLCVHVAACASSHYYQQGSWPQVDSTIY